MSAGCEKLGMEGMMLVRPSCGRVGRPRIGRCQSSLHRFPSKYHGWIAFNRLNIEFQGYNDKMYRSREAFGSSVAVEQETVVSNALAPFCHLSELQHSNQSLAIWEAINK